MLPNLTDDYWIFCWPCGKWSRVPTIYDAFISFLPYLHSYSNNFCPTCRACFKFRLQSHTIICLKFHLKLVKICHKFWRFWCSTEEINSQTLQAGLIFPEIWASTRSMSPTTWFQVWIGIKSSRLTARKIDVSCKRMYQKDPPPNQIFESMLGVGLE